MTMRRSSWVSLANRLLQGGKSASRLVRIGGHFATQNVQLDIHAEQGLQNAVVNFAGDAAALPFDGVRADMAKQKQILQGLPEMANDSFQPLQVLRNESAGGRCQA